MRKTKNLTRAGWIVDPESVDRNNGRQMAWDLIPNTYREGAVPVALTAPAAQNATQIAVSALPDDLPAGTALYFGGVKIARVSITAKAKATTVYVDALPTALVAGDTSLYGGCGELFVPSGTAMDEIPSGTYAGKVLPSALAYAGGVQAGLIISDANHHDKTEAKTGYGIALGGVVYENLLPDATGNPKALSNALKTALNSNGLKFRFERYVDSLAG